MRPVDRRWKHVNLHSYIRSKEGEVWKVLKIKGHHYGLQNRSGEQKIIEIKNPEAPVTIMTLSEDELEAYLVKEMGAEVIEQHFPDWDGGIWWCTPFEELKTLGEMKFHLKNFHGVAAKSVNDPGVSAGMNSRKALISCHETTMRDPQPHHTPHIHTKRSEIPFP